jgi:hypothetical protein
MSTLFDACIYIVSVQGAGVEGVSHETVSSQLYVSQSGGNIRQQQQQQQRTQSLAASSSTITTAGHLEQDALVQVTLYHCTNCGEV